MAQRPRFAIASSGRFAIAYGGRFVIAPKGGFQSTLSWRREKVVSI
jgi:hypothetical protein